MSASVLRSAVPAAQPAGEAPLVFAEDADNPAAGQSVSFAPGARASPVPQDGQRNHRTLSDGAAVAAKKAAGSGHGRKSSIGKLSDLFAGRGSSSPPSKPVPPPANPPGILNNGNNGGSAASGTPSLLPAPLSDSDSPPPQAARSRSTEAPSHSRHMSTQSLGPALPSSQQPQQLHSARSVSADLTSQLALLSTSAPSQGNPVARVESHPLSLGDNSSDSQSELNVRPFGSPPGRKQPLVKAETFSALPRNDANVGIIGRIGQERATTEKFSTDFGLGSSLTLPARPSSPAERSFNEERSFTAPPGYGAVAYASHKRDHDFHELFPAVPEGETLVEDYACALQKDILVQGRLYMTDQRMCFYASIFTWVTTILIPFSEVVSIEKKAVLLINNAIEVATKDGKKYFFASFMQRDITHSLLMKLWRRDAEMTTALDVIHFEGSDVSGDLHSHNDDDEGEFVDDHPDDHTDTEEPEHSDYDVTDGVSPGTEVESPGTGGSPKNLAGDRLAPLAEESGRASEAAESGVEGTSPPKKPVVQSASASSLGPLVPLVTPATSSSFLAPGQPHRRRDMLTPSVVVSASHGPGKRRHAHHPHKRHPRSTHSDEPLPVPTQCACTDHGSYVVNLERTYDVRLRALWKLLFGHGSEAIVKKVNEARRNREFKVEVPWSLGGQPVAVETDDGITSGARRTMVWVCPLPGGFGPKQTRNMHEELVVHKDLNVYLTVETWDTAMDVPAGDCFKVHEKLCLVHAEPRNGRPRTTLKMSGRVEFVKSTWLKGLIERNAVEGARSYFEDLDKAIREHFAAEPEVPGEPGERPRRRAKEAVPSAMGEAAAPPSPPPSPAPPERIALLQEEPGIASVLGGIALSLARYLAGEDEPGVRRVGTAVLGMLAVFIFFGYWLLLWRLASTLGQINETLAAIRSALPRQGPPL
ncbi:hypothetical protein DFJ74DRAFT_43187 [Hyaloraphidium curvatum]|nr:hypothetical protein DFJ74DRAFT_43187 [Hyaloraphidium curvatum]